MFLFRMSKKKSRCSWQHNFHLLQKHRKSYQFEMKLYKNESRSCGLSLNVPEVCHMDTIKWMMINNSNHTLAHTHTHFLIRPTLMTAAKKNEPRSSLKQARIPTKYMLFDQFSPHQYLCGFFFAVCLFLSPKASFQIQYSHTCFW